MSTENSNISDEELMLRLQGGAESALAPLMQKWEQPIKGFIFRLVGNTADSDDLAQEVFVRVFQKRATFRAGSRFSSWILKIAANQAKNRLRWWKRRPTLSLNEWLAQGEDTEDINSSRTAQFDQAEAEGRIEAVQIAIAKLSIDERTAIVLFEYEDKSMAEIGAILDCTPKAVENRLYRARKSLARLLLSEGKLKGSASTESS